MASARQHLKDSLICPICMGLLTKPKLLPCSHTFCEGCLTLVHSAQAQAKDLITCGVCRSVAHVSNNNVSNFPTNRIAQSLAENFKERSDKKRTTDSTDGASSGQCCTVCDADDQGLATFYCQYCSEFLCNSCLEQHKRFKKNVFHELVSARDITSGEIRIQLACTEHAQELQQFVCITCLVRICCRCLEVGHQPDRHEVIGIKEYEESHKAAVNLLQEKVEQKTAVIQIHSSFVKEQIGMVQNIIRQRRQEIENVYKGALKRIQQRKDQLLEECNTYERSLCVDLEGIIECNDNLLEDLSAKVSVVTEESTAQREDRSLLERVARVDELEALVKRDNPDASLPESVAARAEFLTFQQAAESNGLDLGIVQVKEWKLRETAKKMVEHKRKYERKHQEQELTEKKERIRKAELAAEKARKEEERRKSKAEEGIPSGFSRGFPGRMSGGFPWRFPGGIIGSMPGGFPGGMAGGMPGGRGGMPGGMGGGMPGGFPGRMPGAMGGGMPGGRGGMPGGESGGMPGGFHGPGAAIPGGRGGNVPPRFFS